MSGPEIHQVSTGDGPPIHAVWTGDFEPAQYCSVYVIDAERPAIVDTGTGARYEAVLEALDRLGIAPEDLAAIVVTHVHLDHAGGAGYLAEACPNADVYVSAAGAPHLVDPERLWEGTKAAVGDQIQSYVEPRPIPDSRLVELADGDRVDLGDRELVGHAAPGHAFHQLIFEDVATGGVFTGDAAGIKTPGLSAVRESSPPPGFDLAGCLADVETIRDLAPTALYLAHYGAHDPEPLLTRYAETLETWVRRVAQKRTELDSDEAVADFFADRAQTVEAWGETKARAETRMNVRGVLESLDRES